MSYNIENLTCPKCGQPFGEGRHCQWCDEPDPRAPVPAAADAAGEAGPPPLLPPEYGAPIPAHGTGRRIASQRHRPLTKIQKAKLAQVAQAAWRGLRAAGALDGAEEQSADAWRHRVQLEECGIVSLTEATQAHYLALLAAFERWLPGLAGDAARHEAGAGADANDHGMAMRAFTDACHAANAAGLGPGYVLSIARAKTSHPIPHHGAIGAHCTARELWELVYTLRNRAAAAAGKGYPARRSQSQRARRKGKGGGR